MKVLDLIEKLNLENNLTKEEIVYLLTHMTEEEKAILFDYSLQTKRKYYGDTVYMRGLIEFTNYCMRNCKYCGIRAKQFDANRYRLTKDEILKCCDQGYWLGYRTFVLQGGEDPYYTDELLVDIISSIKKRWQDVAVTISIGERTMESYQAIKNAGADRYLLRHETANDDLYEAIHEDMSLSSRKECLNNLKAIGFQVGAGFMVGIPGQTPEILAEDLLFLKSLNPHMVGIGPFIPHAKTPLGGYKGGTVEDTLVMLALTRLMLPKVLLPSTTALGTLDNKGREKALKVGANVVMPNLSPTDVREKYELYQDKICTGDEAAHCRQCIEGRINSVGFHVDMGRGDYDSWR
ncbi:MAG: [FeFe] hydrogenase H-cluster radical SAM maturase HydE [Clostridia bacterium]|nr:[FeFe] hydrogenase H-cluster radical SAM maturase HydE [Clostridia bacterium]